jgi:hypothetical protein
LHDFEIVVYVKALFFFIEINVFFWKKTLFFPCQKSFE